MGNEQSGPSTVLPRISPIKQDVYVPISWARNMEDRFPSQELGLLQNQGRTCKNIIKSDVSGIWSIHVPEKLAPRPRNGHFTVQSPTGDCCFIGHGLSDDGLYTFDMWRLDFGSLEWVQIPLVGVTLEPRVGARAVMYEGNIIVFGGFSQPRYFAELHMINTETGEVSLLETTGEEPSPRTSQIMEVVGDKMFIWGGFNGTWPKDLHVLDMKSLVWESYPQNINGRTNIPSIVYKNHILAFGGSKTDGFVDIDTVNYTVSITPSKGSPPPAITMGGSIVLIGDYLFFIGGKNQYSGSLIYACRLENRWWFVLHVFPDNTSVSLEDGHISDIGLFMIPNVSSFSAVYDHQTRSILAFLGEPTTGSPHIHKFALADAFSHINLRDDMCDSLFSHTK